MLLLLERGQYPSFYLRAQSSWPNLITDRNCVLEALLVRSYVSIIYSLAKVTIDYRLGQGYKRRRDGAPVSRN